VESAGEGQGATFVVSLPIEPAATRETSRSEATGTARVPPCESPDLPSLHGIRVLLVDDEGDAREMMASVLQSSGDEGLQILQSRAGVADVLLSDIAMPGTDGYELIRHVRSDPHSTAASIPAAAVTACAGANERERALAAGFQMHLAKPLGPAELAHAVASLAHVHAVGSDTEPSAPY
jgi:CheY-like chemotaxis protein